MRGFGKHGSKYDDDRHEKQRKGNEQTRFSENTRHSLAHERPSDDTTPDSRKHKAEDYCDRHGKQRRSDEQTHFSERSQHSPAREILLNRTRHEDYYDQYRKQWTDSEPVIFDRRARQEIPSFDHCERRLRQLTIHIKTHHSLTLLQQEELNEVLPALEYYLTRHEKLDFYQWEQAKDHRLVAQSIAFLLYNCGQLAAFIDTPLATSSLQFLLERILNQRIHTTNTPRPMDSIDLFRNRH